MKEMKCKSDFLELLKNPIGKFNEFANRFHCHD